MFTSPDIAKRQLGKISIDFSTDSSGISVIAYLVEEQSI